MKWLNILILWTHIIWFVYQEIRPELSATTTIEEWLTERMNVPLINRATHDTTWNICVLVYWHIWKTRCKLVFEGKPLNPTEIIDCVYRKDDEYRANTVRPNNIEPRITPSTWTPPTQGVIKWICDTSWCARTKLGGIQVIARDSEGWVVGCLIRRIQCEDSESLEA